MGGSSSTQNINHEIANRNISKNTLESLNKFVSTMTTNNIVSSQTQTATNISQFAEIKVGSIVARGPSSRISNINLNIDQSQNINFKATDESIQENNINTELALSILTALTSKVENSTLNNLVTDAEATQTKSGMSFLSGDSALNQNVNAKIENTNISEVQRKLTNMITNTINQNAESMVKKDCILNSLTRGSIDVGTIAAIEGGTITDINLTVKQATDAIQDCILKSIQTSKITTAIVNNLGVKIDDSVKTESQSEGSLKAKSSLDIEGLFGGMSSIISGIVVVLLIILSLVFYFKK